MLINQSENSKPKFTPFRSISYGFWDNGKFILTNQKTAKPKNFKICNFAFSNPMRVQNLLHFPLSLTVSEISANLCFFKFWENLWKFRKFWLFWNFQKCCVVIIDNAMIQNFHPFRSTSYRFWDNPFLHKNRKSGSFSKILNPWPWRLEP